MSEQTCTVKTTCPNCHRCQTFEVEGGIHDLDREILCADCRDPMNGVEGMSPPIYPTDPHLPTESTTIEDIERIMMITLTDQQKEIVRANLSEGKIFVTSESIPYLASFTPDPSMVIPEGESITMMIKEEPVKPTTPTTVSHHCGKCGRKLIDISTYSTPPTPTEYYCPVCDRHVGMETGTHGMASHLVGLPKSTPPPSPTSTVTTEQQPPVVDAVGQDVWLLVMKDMEDRRRAGIEKYGVLVRHDNGRDHLVDAYQEILDLAVYIRAQMEKDRELRERLIAVVGELVACTSSGMVSSKHERMYSAVTEAIPLFKELIKVWENKQS